MFLPLTRSPSPVPCPCLPLTRCTPSRRSLRPPMCTTPPTPPTTSSPSSPPTPPQSTRPSTFPCTLSRPTSSPELPTLRPPPLPTSPPLLTALSLVLATPPLASSDMWLLPTKCSQTTHSTSRLCNPKTSIYLFMFGNCSLFRRLIFR